MNESKHVWLIGKTIYAIPTKGSYNFDKGELTILGPITNVIGNNMADIYFEESHVYLQKEIVDELLAKGHDSFGRFMNQQDAINEFNNQRLPKET